MSVINRMLADLERRQAPPARRAGWPAAPPARSRRRRWLWNLVPASLALALVAVAAGLWVQRAPKVLSAAVETPGPDAPDTEARAAGTEGTPADEEASANASAASSAAERPRLVRVAFGRDGDRVILELGVDGPVPEPAGYTREGGLLHLRLPVESRVDGVPAPPGDQSVFRTLALAPQGEMLALRLGVDAEARFDVQEAAGGLRITGRLPDSGSTGTAAAPAPEGSEAARAASPTAVAAAAGNEDGVRQAPAEAEAAQDGDTGGAVADDGAGSGRADTADTEPGAPDGGSDAAAHAEPRTADDSGGDAGTVEKSDRSGPAVRAARRYREAREALSAGQPAAARRHLRAALDHDPGLHPARDLLVALLRRTGQDRAARDVLAEGLARDPDRVAFAKPYARLLVDAGALERAAAVLEEASRAASGDAEYHALQGAIEQRLGRHERAAAAYTRALEIDSGRGRWWLGLGISLAAAGHPGEARAAFREARAAGDLDERLDRWAAERIEALGQS
jgi:Tfp pilus assembly protein PilF